MKAARCSLAGLALLIVLSNWSRTESYYTVTNPGTLLGGPTSQANGINDNGQVVGVSSNRAFLWQSGSGMQDLGMLPGKMLCKAKRHRHSGQVVGGDVPDHVEFHWPRVPRQSGRGMRILGHPQRRRGRSDAAINSSGQVAGWAYYNSGSFIQHAFLWQSGSPMQDLGSALSGTAALVPINRAGRSRAGPGPV